MRYTFEEEEDEYTSDMSARRSMRNSGVATPSEPTVTASGRQVRPRMGNRYAETGLDGAEPGNRDTPASAEYERSDKSEEPSAPPPDANVKYIKPKGRGWKGWAIAEDTGEGSGTIHGYNEVDAMDEDEDEAMSSGESGGEWDGGDDESDVIRARDADDEDDDMDDEASDDEMDEPQSLIVTLKYGKRGAVQNGQPQQSTSTAPQASNGANKLEPPTAPKPASAQLANGVQNVPNGIPSATQPAVQPVLQPAAPPPSQPTFQPPAEPGVQPALQPAVQPPVNPDPVQSPLSTMKLVSHPSPTKVTATPVQPATLPAKVPSYVASPAPAPLTNGTSVPSQYKQQTLDSLFSRSAPPPNEAGNSDMQNPSVPPVTST